MLMRSSDENVLIQSQSGEWASQTRCAEIRFCVAVCLTSVCVAGGETVGGVVGGVVGVVGVVG